MAVVILVIDFDIHCKPHSPECINKKLIYNFNIALAELCNLLTELDIETVPALSEEYGILHGKMLADVDDIRNCE